MQNKISDHFWLLSPLGGIIHNYAILTTLFKLNNSNKIKKIICKHGHVFRRLNYGEPKPLPRMHFPSGKKWKSVRIRQKVAMTPGIIHRVGTFTPIIPKAKIRELRKGVLYHADFFGPNVAESKPIVLLHQFLSFTFVSLHQVDFYPFLTLRLLNSCLVKIQAKWKRVSVWSLKLIKHVDFKNRLTSLI